MTDITLSRTETKLLTAAAERGGAFDFPDSTKPSTRERTLGRLLRDGLIVAEDAGHALTPAGYRAIGIRPPRAKRSGVEADAAPRVTKNTTVLELLGRPEGASLLELTDATGWLPHTARAALSRIRSAGTALAKSKREDGTTTYRILPAEPAPVQRTRRPKGGAAEAAAA